MNREILRDIKFDVTEQEVFRQLKMLSYVDDEDYADDVARVKEMMAEAEKIANPKSLFEVFSIDEKGEDYIIVNGQKYASALVRKNVDKVNRVIPYVTTCGAELEEWSKTFDDPLEQYWADGIKLVYLGKMMVYSRNYVKEKYFAGEDMSSMNPGSLIEWPLSQQQPLFDSLGDVKEQTGAYLTPTYLILPSKSGSGFYFSAEEHYENCKMCPIEDCPNRRAKMEVEPRK